MDTRNANIVSESRLPYKVGFLLLEGFALMSYASAVEPLRAANLLLPQAYNIQHLSLNTAQVRSSGQALIKTIPIESCTDAFDLVLVLAGGDPFKMQHAQLTKWLRQKARQGVHIGGVSGGPVVLALADLMKGRRMTLHWEHSKVLSESNPELIVERSLYVIDRDRLTCAGGTAALDMMHALITAHHGAEFARKVSDWFLHTNIRVASEPQRSGRAERYGTNNASVLTVIEMMRDNIAEPLALSQLADRAGLGVRQLNRLFKNCLSMSTINFYRDLRLDRAHKLLSQSSLSITDIAVATGFVSSAHFSNSFKRKYNESPSSFRKR